MTAPVVMRTVQGLEDCAHVFELVRYLVSLSSW